MNDISADDLLAHLPSPLSTDTRVAIGEPASHLIGWRRSHKQAAAAFAVAAQGDRPIVRYSEVPLLASATKDELLQASLREMYLAPLTTGRNGGEVLRKTLRSYFAADRNASSASFALEVSRQTVAQRLRTVEEKLGQPLERYADALNIALQLEELGYISS